LGRNNIESVLQSIAPTFFTVDLDTFNQAFVVIVHNSDNAVHSDHGCPGPIEFQAKAFEQAS